MRFGWEGWIPSAFRDFLVEYFDPLFTLWRLVTIARQC